MFEQVKHVIAEDDAALVYSSRDGDLVCCGAHLPRAKRILAEHIEKVLGVYDRHANDQWVKDDLKWFANRVQVKQGV
jgi:hypothetical protein